MVSSPPRQLLPIIRITRAQPGTARHSPARRGTEGMPTRWAEGLLVLTKVSACRWVLPVAAFWLITLFPIPPQIP